MALMAAGSLPDLPTAYLRAVDHLSMKEASPTWRWCFEILLRAYVADRDRLSAADRQRVLSLIADLSNTDPGAENRETLMNMIFAEVHVGNRPADASWARLPLMPSAGAELWTAEEVLNWILAKAAPGRLPMRVLKRAIELDLVGWCTNNAADVLERRDDEALSVLTPLDRWYLQTPSGLTANKCLRTRHHLRHNRHRSSWVGSAAPAAVPAVAVRCRQRGGALR